MFVKAAVNGVAMEAMIAAALTALMILLFLERWCSKLIITISIPPAILAEVSFPDRPEARYRARLDRTSNQVLLKPAAVGRDCGAEVAVIGGLSADDNTILNPPDSMMEKPTVRIVKPDSGAKS